MFREMFGGGRGHQLAALWFARHRSGGGPDFGHGFEGNWLGGARGPFGRVFGGGRDRLFEAGDVKLVMLKLLAEEPSYGYQLMKRMEERLAGGYMPSAGVIYPTLTLLEEEGLAASTTEGNKKTYSVTEEGLTFLKENQRRVDELFARMDEVAKGYERERSPEIIRAFVNLRGAVIARVTRGNLPPEQIHKITEIINDAAKAIDSL